METDQMDLCYNALRSGSLIYVKTATRSFEGRVFDIARSAYYDEFTAGVVDAGRPGSPLPTAQS